MIIAALMAEGVSEIESLHHIDRGYENFEEKFRNIGADIIRYNDETVEPKLLQEGKYNEASI